VIDSTVTGMRRRCCSVRAGSSDETRVVNRNISRTLYS
jgi:hypothetical protein